MKKPLTVEHDVLFFAFRYALTRASYASLTVTSSIIENLPLLNDAEINAYVREIEELENEGFAQTTMEVDRTSWLELRNFLVAELNRRDSHH